MKFKSLIYRKEDGEWFYVATYKLEKEIVKGDLPTLYPPTTSIKDLTSQAHKLQEMLGENLSIKTFIENLARCELIDVELNAL